MIELYLSWGAHVFDLPQHCRVASAIKAFIETHGHVFFVVEKALALAPKICWATKNVIFSPISGSCFIAQRYKPCSMCPMGLWVGSNCGAHGILFGSPLDLTDEDSDLVRLERLVSLLKAQ